MYIYLENQAGSHNIMKETESIDSYRKKKSENHPTLVKTRVPPPTWSRFMVAYRPPPLPPMLYNQEKLAT